MKVLRSEGYTAPTATQAQSWPIVLGQRDVISVARTGSGKTCGFLLPAFQKLVLARQEQQQRGRFGGGGAAATRNRKPSLVGAYGRLPQVLVLAPTRELALQISDEADKYARSSGFATAAIYGGAAKGGQISSIKNGVDVIVATPGRCNDLLEMGVLNLSKISYLVLDEADRMLDMGFEPQIRQIVEQIPENRQSIFFTATWPREVQGLARDFLQNPVQINIGDSSGLNANKAITQNIVLVDEHGKWDALVKTLDDINTNENKNKTRNKKQEREHQQQQAQK
jgi:ATP-dependent RNA helicase DDX5/DBP2